MREYLVKICNTEGYKYQDSGIDTICKISGGDMRKAINYTQQSGLTTDIITNKSVLKVCKVPDPEHLKEVIKYCCEAQLNEGIKILEDLVNEGYNYMDIINGLCNELIVYQIDEQVKLNLIDIVNVTKTAMSRGVKSKVQLTALVARMILLLEKSKN
jgi:replication factor C subunit 2/4